MTEGGRDSVIDARSAAGSVTAAEQGDVRKSQRGLGQSNTSQQSRAITRTGLRVLHTVQALHSHELPSSPPACTTHRQSVHTRLPLLIAVDLTPSLSLSLSAMATVSIPAFSIVPSNVSCTAVPLPTVPAPSPSTSRSSPSLSDADIIEYMLEPSLQHGPPLPSQPLTDAELGGEADEGSTGIDEPTRAMLLKLQQQAIQAGQGGPCTQHTKSSRVQVH